MKKNESQDITLRDVITHIQAVRNEVRDMEKRLSKKIDANTNAIVTLTQRIDALEEDLTATIQDTVKIRRHVGMRVASE